MAPKPEIREVGSVQSREEMRREVEQRVDQHLREKYGDSWFGKVFAALERDAMVNDQARMEMDMNASILAQGSSVRQAPPIPAMNYDGEPHRQLKESVEAQADPGEVARVGDAWVGVGKWMIDFQRQFGSAIAASESEWRGTSGDQARQFMADVGNYIGKAGASAQLAGTQAALHSDALARVRAMPDPIDFDVDKANAELRTITDPFARSIKYAEHMATYEASENARKEAARLAAGFDQNISGSSTMPAFASPPAMGAGGPGTPEPPGPGNPGGSGGRDGGGLGPGAGGSGTSSQGNGGGSVPAGRPGSPSVVVPGPVNPPTGPASNPPVGLTPVQGFQPPRGGGNQGFVTQPDNQNPSQVGGVLISGPTGGFAGGGGEFADGRGGSAGGGGRGFGPTGGPGAGGGPKAGIGGPAAEHAVGGRGTGAAGTTGRGGAATGMGGMGTGRGQGGEDTEHERPSFLVEPDPDATFGTDEMTAPPVIGA